VYRSGSRPRLLDLFCGAGGAGAGYAQAGFDVVGVDIRPQPRYPFQFLQADALEVLAESKYLMQFDVIHASPPCQRYTVLQRCAKNAQSHPDLIPEIAKTLRSRNQPYIIENVPGAPLRDPLLLCGEVFGLEVVRHRLFETNRPLVSRGCRHVRGGTATGKYVAFKRGVAPGRVVPPRQTKSEYRTALRVEWMTTKESREAIPPAYTRYLGVQLLALFSQDNR
jgi:DNA (cytosine-5)-methyltransferase 1